jgi:hypothetical protein
MNPTILKLNDQWYRVIDIHSFREMYHLAAEFSITHYETKDYSGLARIQAGSPALNILRVVTLANIPNRVDWSGLLALINHLSHHFRTTLEGVNDTVGLKPVEMDFAVAGFEDVCRAFCYALIRSKSLKTQVDFAQVYSDWLSSTMRLTQTTFSYTYTQMTAASLPLSETWQIQVVNNAYGRMGLLVTTPSETVIVRDHTYACPAEGFMYTLLSQVAARIQEALARVSPSPSC